MRVGAFERLLAPLKARLAMLVARAVVARVNDALKIQGLQVTVLAGETRDQVERFQNYGFTSVPKEGAEAVVLSVGGNRDHVLAIVVDDRRYRLKGLEGGEVALYSSVTGQTVILRQDGRVEIRAPEFDFVATGAVTIKGDTVEIEATGGTLSLKGSDVAVESDSSIDMTSGSLSVDASALVQIDSAVVDIEGKGDYKTHLHSGVQVGGNNSGPVV